MLKLRKQEAAVMGSPEAGTSEVKPEGRSAQKSAGEGRGTPKSAGFIQEEETSIPEEAEEVIPEPDEELESESNQTSLSSTSEGAS